MAEWRHRTIGDLCDAGVIELQTGPFGSQLHAHEYVEEGIPVVPTEAIRNRQIERSVLPKIRRVKADELRRHRLKQGDILFARRGAQATGHIGYVRGAEEGFICGTGAIRLRVNDGNSEIMPDFLSHVLADPESVKWFKFHAIGATMPNLNEGIIRSFPLRIPPRTDQIAISRILGTLDDKIELNRRMNETLEAMARAIFKSWFMDFDPVRAKAEGRDPGLPKLIADLFPDRFKESKLGEIPEGWELSRLGDVTGFLGGYAFKSQDWREHGVPVVKIGSVKPGIVDLSAVSFVSEEVAEVTKRYRLSPGDLLLGMTGYVGEVGLVPLTDNPPLLNQRVGKFVLETAGTSAAAFLYCLTRRAEFKSEVETNSHGTAQANVSAEGILSIRIVVPPKTLRDKFNQIGQQFLDRILANHHESYTLSALRDVLLPKLISGELRVGALKNAIPCDGHREVDCDSRRQP